jgi:hypothetical protein
LIDFPIFVVVWDKFAIVIFLWDWFLFLSFEYFPNIDLYPWDFYACLKKNVPCIKTFSQIFFIFQSELVNADIDTVVGECLFEIQTQIKLNRLTIFLGSPGEPGWCCQLTPPSGTRNRSSGSTQVPPVASCFFALLLAKRISKSYLRVTGFYLFIR